MLSKEAIEKFRAIYKQCFGKEISKEEALEKGVKLLRLMSLVYRPMTKEEFKIVCTRQLELRKKIKSE